MADEFRIELSAGLNAKSKNQVISEIDGIKEKVKDLEINLKIDSNTASKIENQLNHLQVSLNNVNITPAALNSLVSQVNNALKGVDFSSLANNGQFQKTGQQIGRQYGENIARGVSQASKQIDSALKSFSDLKSFSELNKSISHLQIDSSELKDYQGILDKVKQSYKEFGQVKITNETFNNGVLEKFKVNIEQVNGDLKETKSFTMSLNDNKNAFIFDGIIKGSESVVQHLDKSQNAVNQTAEAINALKTKAQADKIQINIDTGSYESKVDSLIARTRQWTDENGNARISTKELKTALDELNTANTNLTASGGNTIENQQRLIDAEKNLDTEIKRIRNDITSMNAEFAKTSAIDNLRNTVQQFYDINTKSHWKYGSRLKLIMSELGQGAEVPISKLKKLEKQFITIQSEARRTGQLGKNWFDTLKSGIQSFVPWLSTTSVVMKGVQTFRDMYKAVYEVDTAMTNLYKVTDETSSKYNQFLESASSNAKELGRSISSLVEQTANWAKLGFSLDEAEELAKISSIYANVGEVSDDVAVSDLVTAMKSFNIEANNAIGIVDSLNKLGNEFATSSKDLGEGLQKSASSLHTAGSDINETLAMLTGGAEITQSAGEFGNFLKVATMRIRGMKGELEELGEEVDDSVDSISKVQTQILNLTHGSVNIFDKNNEFRDYYEIMEDIARVHSKLSSTEQASLDEILFGKQRANQGAALIQAFESGQIQKALEASQNSAGSAMQEQERWLDSLEAKTQQFQAAFESLSNTVLDSSVPKFFVDLGTSAVSSLDEIIDKIGTLGTIGMGAGAYAGFKELG